MGLGGSQDFRRWGEVRCEGDPQERKGLARCRPVEVVVRLVNRERGLWGDTEGLRGFLAIECLVGVELAITHPFRLGFALCAGDSKEKCFSILSSKSLRFSCGRQKAKE